MAKTPGQVIVSTYCGSKVAFSNQEDAEAQAARHYACDVCQDGTARMEAYPCYAGSPHFHTGHMGVHRR